MPVVCIAAHDIASQFKDLRRAFEEIGWEVITYVHQQPESCIIEADTYNYVGMENVPEIFNRRIKSSLFPASIINKGIRKLANTSLKYQNKHLINKLIKKCDLFIFIWSTFLSDYSDLKFIRSAGKKVGIIFCGDEARWYYGMKQEFEEYGLSVVDYGENYDYGINGLKERIKRIRTAEKYADFIFSKREQAQLQLRPFYHFPMTVYQEDYVLNEQQREKNPLVVHAPSNTSVKGTSYVLSAFDNLKRKGVIFTPILLKNIKHKEAKEIYSNADIVIDQLFLPGGGKLSSEALASGKVVMGNMSYKVYDQGFPIDDCPIIDININNIENQLESTINNYTLRKELAARAHEYVSKHLRVQKLVEKISKIYNGENLSYDFVPKFFYSNYIPESEMAVEELNKWNQFVSACEWYKSSIPKGERNNLKF
jgi:glycosyltransferase involved in cell wall biosynthesis